MIGRLGLTLAALAGLSACATTGGEYPSVRYASAAQDGVIAMQIAGRPTHDDMILAEERWGRAIADAYACDLGVGPVSEAAIVGAMELAAMSAASRGRQNPFEGVVGYMSALNRHRATRRSRPDAERCTRLDGWVDMVRTDGRELLLREAEQRLLPPG
jgi:hypothetical protein